ncbi:MAG: Do family serine endopeptidase [Rudaea sp.]|uniref:Do family serine endopeptidase n=1 Tax=unclassified Rudaea TaxID=2627037 RepID=UPI0010F47FDE|nr:MULTISPECIES: Do family serine endopeptidase [unclassified Rudaea]MBN8884674.1 Do family serine endopeptidase [Rudaea sp.]
MSKVYKFGAFAALFALASAAHADLPDFTQLVEKTGPSVVNITATQGDGNAQQQSDADDQDGGDLQNVPPGMQDFFRRFFGPNGPRGGGPRGGGESHGSGFVISADGYILTNNHVVDGAEKVIVRLSDRRELDAKVVGTDKDSDVALLKVNASGLPAVNIGDSSKLKPGQWVVAIGSPFGFDHTVTHGVVSYVGRGGRAPGEQYVPFIQTDVPINPGNSGGPLFNLDGQVVGINSQIYSNSGGYMGVSFAVPINMAMNTVEQLKTTGKVSRGMLGVNIQRVGRDEAKALGLPQVSGALVTNVNPGSGAEKAGIQPQDVILAYNDKAIDQWSDLPLLVGSTKPGTKASLKVYRDGKTLDMPVTIGELSSDKPTKTASLGGSAKPQNNPLGILVEDISAEDRKTLGLKDQNGVAIQQAGPVAQRGGLQRGDIVLKVGRSYVKNVAEFDNAVKDVKPGDSVMLLVRRGDAAQFVTLTAPKKG